MVRIVNIFMSRYREISAILTILFLMEVCCGDLFGQQEITVQVNTPSTSTKRAPESTLAPTRDFMITGTITGTDASMVKNLAFSLYKVDPGTGNETLVRSVDTKTFTQNTQENLYVEFDQIVNTRARTREAEESALKKYPMPDLVYDSSLTDATEKTRSINDPTNKAVLVTYENGDKYDGTRFSAIVLGGATKSFFTDYGTWVNGSFVPYNDLNEGNYVLKVTAYNAEGDVIAGVKTVNSEGTEITDSGLGLTYSPSNLVFSRYTSNEHIDKFTKLANSEADPNGKYKVMLDYFPGYWNDYGSNRAFGELLGRWEENDWIEYEYAPKTLGMIYDINSSCATLKEIYRVIKSGHLESGAIQISENEYKLNNQVYLYHYDLGDESLTYTRRDNTTATLSGKLVLFKNSIDPHSVDINTVYATEEDALVHANNRYSHLDLTRVDLYNKDADPLSVQENRDRLTDFNKQVSQVGTYQSEGKNFVLAKPEQSIGLYGVITPLKANISDVTQKTMSLYPDDVPARTYDLDVVEYEIKPEDDTWIKSINYTLKDPNGNTVETGSTTPGLIRTMTDGKDVWENSPSLFEFKTLLDDELFSEEGVYTLDVEGANLHGVAVDRTNQTLEVFVTRTGVRSAANMPLTSNQLSAADAMLDMLIEGNTASEALANAYMGATRNETASMLSQLSGSQTMASISKLASNPLTTSINRLDASQNDMNDHCRSTGCLDFWGTYIHHGINVKGSDEIESFDISGNGLAVGYDRAISIGRLGAAFVYEDALDNGSRYKNELDDITAVAYGKINLTDRLYFNGLFGYSWRDYRTDRYNQWTNYSENLRGDFSGRGIWANFRLERELKFARGILTPFVGYEANWNEFDQYDETGGVSALSFDGRKEDYGFLQAGARTSFQIRNLNIDFRGMYVHRLSGPDRAEYTAAFTGQDGFRYQFGGQGVLNSIDFLDVNLDLRYHLSDWTNLLVGYNGLYGDRLTGHMIDAGFSTEW